MFSCAASSILAAFAVPGSNRKEDLEVPRTVWSFPAAEMRWDVETLRVQSGLRLPLGFSRDARAVPPEQYTDNHKALWKGFLQHIWPPKLS